MSNRRLCGGVLAGRQHQNMDGECCSRPLSPHARSRNITMKLTRFFLFKLEMKQRYLVGKLNVPDEKDGGPEEVTVETLGKDSA